MKVCCAGKLVIVVALMCGAFAISSSAQTLTTIYDFCSQPNCADGGAPWGGLLEGTDGNFYGTTSDIGLAGDGTVYRLSSSGTLTVLHTFTDGQDGARPVAGMIQASDGNFYGVTTVGGGASGCGTVYRVTHSGTLTTLYKFAGSPSDGCQPFGPLVQASDGNLYGTTYTGGSATYGMVFKVTTGGTETNLHNFCTQSGCPDGANPQAGLVQGSDGNLYGETLYGGPNGYGSVFKITTSGTLTTLFSFNAADGSEPTGGLVQGRDGNFYGTTSQGGAAGGAAGTVFKMTPSGTLTTLYNFCPLSNCTTSGGGPNAGLVQASDGNFYGTTVGGGAHESGTAFAITPGGDFTSLYSFCSLGGTNCTDGAYPEAGLIQASDGKLYGVTSEGGNANFAGTAFALELTEYTLTVSPSGSGSVTSTDGGWAFTGWGGACSGTGSCQVTMTQNTNVSATFYQLPVTLTVSVAGDGSVTSTDGFINCPGTCTHTYQPNTQVTLNATPASGWAFSGWTGACSGVGSCNVIMTQNLAVTAVFVEPGHGIQFTPVTPCRLVDTRKTNDPIQGGTSQSYTLPQLGGCNIPSSAAAYSLNVTVVPITTLGYLTIWPTGEAQPGVSTMNSPDGRIKANAAIVPAGTNGAVSVYVTDTTNIILDIDGYFTTPGSQTYQFYPLTPCRLVDTRQADGELGGPALLAQTPRSFPLLESSCIPAGLNPLAYSLNFTVVPNPSGQPLGYLTVWPTGETQPVVSTLNNPTATVVANGAIVPAGTGGAVDVYAYNTTDLLIDINGYFAAPGTGGFSMYPVAPCRVLDTRHSGGSFKGEKTVNVEGSACAPPANAAAYIFNATVVPPAPMLYLTLWPDGEKQPTVSTLNA
ncbi:MAG: choice-of-anchor tandem repeat GloVer-containing protein, partial [Candidatus Korobacteraceae bacterium]